jgi:hypothetical protein
MKLSQKEIEIQKQFNFYLPGVKIEAMRMGSGNDVKQAAFSASPVNRDWQRSSYFYKGNLSFIHFTSLAALESIIKERVLRLYNINNLNDPREYSYAGDLLTLDPDRRKDARENSFLISMCESSILKEKTGDEFNLWRLYGHEGRGAAIEIQFDDHTHSLWRDYFLSEVHYGVSAREPLKKLNALLTKDEKDTPSVVVDLARIACFHKSSLFGLEKEIRLQFDNRSLKGIGTTIYSKAENNVISPIINIDIDKSISKGKKIQYLELPIYHKEFIPISEKHFIPIPKIKRIILGYSYKDNFKEVGLFFRNHCIKSLGHPLVIVQSRLTNYYHDYFGSSKGS